jgi:UDP-glucuronate 4-epimerase
VGRDVRRDADGAQHDVAVAPQPSPAATVANLIGSTRNLMESLRLAAGSRRAKSARRSCDARRQPPHIAGFIGSHLVDRLLQDGWEVTGVDNFDDFYGAALKRSNIAEQLDHPSYSLMEIDIRDRDAMLARLSRPYDVVVHLAAKAGVRPSIADPILYQDVNVRGTQNMLEFARTRRIPQFVFASSSSVYGVNPNVPWREEDHVLQPISPYASTKVSGELMGHVYSRLYGIRFVALRFFTAYGPRQRPDLAIRKFTQLILNGERLPFYGDGSTRRDYTYIDDIVDGIVGAMRYVATPYEVINLGNSEAVTLGELVRSIEEVLGLSASLMPLPDQPGDVPQTWASVDKARSLLGYEPKTPLRIGLERFVSWLVALRAAPVGGGKADFIGRGMVPARSARRLSSEAVDA